MSGCCSGFGQDVSRCLILCCLCSPRKLQFAPLAHPCPVQFRVVDLPNTHLLCKVKTLNKGDANSEVTVYYQVMCAGAVLASSLWHLPMPLRAGSGQGCHRGGTDTSCEHRPCAPRLNPLGFPLGGFPETSTFPSWASAGSWVSAVVTSWCPQL